MENIGTGQTQDELEWHDLKFLTKLTSALTKVIYY